MPKISLDCIWSEYTKSPDPAAGMQSLQQACSALTKHVLLPSHIVLSNGGFLLHPADTKVLLDVVSLLSRGLNLAMTAAMATMDVVRADVPHISSSCTVAASDAPPSSTQDRSNERLHTSAKPQRGQDHARSPPRGKSTPSPTMSIADLAFKYVAGLNSVSQRTAAIIRKKTLEDEDIMDHGNDLDASHIGQFALEPELFVRIDKTVIDMQSMLTHASSIAGRKCSFLIDPDRVMMSTLRGTARLLALHIMWDGLIERMHVVQDILEMYRLGEDSTDPVRQACDAAALWQRQAFDKELTLREHQAVEARLCREHPEATQAVAIVVSPPERSPHHLLRAHPSP
ncbi:hypothetical protein DFH08DRAFT_1072749 [Mycena albidolilacea]|uniref:Uncharacterized protein n=1 Tax=Mycena albidolilacea TaxID=1033008 RepID=A0AAD7ANB0_9AGAR|nr:hypothetical protein DFH08DRAFT_1072749 [Mycena albidolilacea]